jgi:hypothetical protein
LKKTPLPFTPSNPFSIAVLHLHSFKESAEAAGTEMERNSTTAKFGIQERKRDPVNQN